MIKKELIPIDPKAPIWHWVNEVNETLLKQYKKLDDKTKQHMNAFSILDCEDLMFYIDQMHLSLKDALVELQKQRACGF